MRILLLLSWLAATTAGGAEVSLRIVADTSGFSGQVLAQVESLLCRSDPDVICEGESVPRSVQKRLIVAIGARGLALAESSAPDIPMLAVFPPRPMLDNTETRRVVGVIQWEMPPGRFLNLVSLLTGRRGSTVTMLASATTQARVGRYELAAAERGMKLQVERVDREAEVGPAVERLVMAKGVFLALPDPVAQTQITVAPLLLITYRAGVPVVGFSEAYLRAGAAVAIYSTPEQVAQQVLDSVNHFRRTGALPALQPLKYYSVGTNPAVLRSLGISLPPAEELEGRLHQMRE